MYVIVIYDVDQSRVAKVCKFLRQFLNWVQNSAFEGEITESQLERIRTGILDRIEPNEDSVYIYKFRDAKFMRKEVIGVERMPTDTIM
ncbi:MAG TPA: CRISPR-associated endonuclease Cas2 [Armatimonadetes bacterium]|nr:CRISPR-associated endonuclease Cas2 [Armatimonadota bacterium]